MVSLLFNKAGKWDLRIPLWPSSFTSKDGLRNCLAVLSLSLQGISTMCAPANVSGCFFINFNRLGDFTAGLWFTDAEDGLGGNTVQDIFLSSFLLPRVDFFRLNFLHSGAQRVLRFLHNTKIFS